MKHIITYLSVNLKYMLKNKYSIKIKTEKKPYDISITFLLGKEDLNLHC